MFIYGEETDLHRRWLTRGVRMAAARGSLSCGTGRMADSGARVSAKRGPAAAADGGGGGEAEQGGVAAHRVVRPMEGRCRVLDLMWS